MELSDPMQTTARNSRVTITMVDGREEEGIVIRFSPQMPRLVLARDEIGLHYINTSEVAFIGFHWENEGESEAATLSRLTPVLVHTVAHRTFNVMMLESQQRRSGFFAFNLDRFLPFERIYFYSQGVRMFERSKPIGEVLVEQKMATPDQIELGLKEQHERQKRPLGAILIEQKRVEPVEVEKALAVQGKKRKQLGTILLEAGLITEEDLHRALAEQSKNRDLKLGQVMIKLGIITEAELTSALSNKFNLPHIDLDDYPIDEKAIGEIDEQLLLRHQMLPVRCDETSITIACADPLDMQAFDAIRFRSKKRLNEVLATPTQIRKHLERQLGAQSSEEGDWLWIENIAGDEGEIESEVVEVKAAGAPPIVRLVNKIIINALIKGASDIHILPQAKKLLLLYRINGDLIEEQQLEKWVQRRVISRIKLLCGMNIADHRVTQDGRMMVMHEKSKVEFRVSCIPNAFGESLVMRVLSKDLAVSLHALGLSEQDLNHLQRMSHRPYGLILSTGPTGSGKSTTLFSLLRTIQSRPVHIITIEDPIESEIPGVNQIQVNNKVGLTFAKVLRNVLRHDPDVIMVGEMRDQETAMIGVEAALTGHLMLSTLHTNSAVDTVVRLHDLGIPNYLLAPALLGVISQNLLKRLCPNCREAIAHDDEIFDLIRDAGGEVPPTIYRPKGCGNCRDSGFIGRVMVYELLVVTDKVRQAIHEEKIGRELQQIAIEESMQTKSQHALRLAAEGVLCRDDLMKMLV